MFEYAGGPEFPRVCEKSAGGSKHFIERFDGAAAALQFFGKRDALLFELADLIFVSGDERMAVGLQQPVHDLARLSFEDGQFALDLRLASLRPLQTHVPEIGEHGQRRTEERGRGLQFLEQRLKLPFHVFAPDRLPVRAAIAVMAEVIGVMPVAALGPCARHRMIAAGAGNEPAQGKFRIGVFAGRRIRLARKPVLNTLPCGESNDRLMLAGMQDDPPFGDGDISGVKGALQKVDSVLQPHFAPRIARRGGNRFQKAPHFGGRLETPCRKTFEGFLHNRRMSIGDDHFAVAGDVGEGIAQHRSEDVIAVHHPRPHPVDHLFGVLLALVL